MSMRNSVNSELTRSREERERARDVLTGSIDQDSPPLRTSDLSAVHTLHPFLHRKPLYHCVTLQPLGLTLLLALAPLVRVVGEGTGAAPEEDTLVVDWEGVRLQLPQPNHALIRRMWYPVLRSVGLDVTTRLMERGAEVCLSNGTDEDRGTWSRDVCYAALEAGTACHAFGKSGWSRSWTVAHHLLVNVQPRPVLLGCAAGLVTDYAELVYLAAVCVL